MLVTLVLAAGGVIAGLLGALLGLGGGILIVPLLTLGFGLPIREAVGVSLVCVIVTSSAAAGVYLQERIANLRLGMVLELFSAAGALVGGLAAFLLPDSLLAALFSALLLYTALAMLRRSPARGGAAEVEAAAVDESLARPPEADTGARRGDGATLAAPRLVDALSGRGYHVHGLPVGVAGSLVAGLASALLGIGAGIVKVPLMHLAMGVPLRVATATSNLMIGVTAAASAVIYLLRGGIDPLLAGPTAVGVFIGASVGSRSAGRVDVRLVRALFVIVLLYTAVQMARRALGMA